MTRVTVFATGVALLLGSSAIASPAQDAVHKGRLVIPESAIERPEDIGLRAHTPYQIFVPGDRARLGADPNSIALPHPAVPPPVGPPFSGYAFETPASLACIYHLVAAVAGCNPNTFKTNANGRQQGDRNRRRVRLSHSDGRPECLLHSIRPAQSDCHYIQGVFCRRQRRLLRRGPGQRCRMGRRAGT